MSRAERAQRSLSRSAVVHRRGCASMPRVLNQDSGQVPQRMRSPCAARRHCRADFFFQTRLPPPQTKSSNSSCLCQSLRPSFQASGPSPATPAPPRAAARSRVPLSHRRQPDRTQCTSAMLPCARSVLRRRGLASSVPRRCGGEGECSTCAGELVANARCSSTLAALGGGGRVLEHGGRWAYPQTGVIGAGRMARTQTRCFLGCGDGEEGGVLSKVYEERRVMGYAVNRELPYGSSGD